jgi:hypothetical protein
MSGATLDLTRMALSTSAPLSLALKGDGPTALRLAGPWAGPVSITRDGVSLGTASPSGGAITLTDNMAGAHTYVLTPA